MASVGLSSTPLWTVAKAKARMPMQINIHKLCMASVLEMRDDAATSDIDDDER